MEDISEDLRTAGRPGPSIQDLIASDSREVPPFLVDERNDFATTAGLDIGRYLTREFYDLEMTRLWGRVWQIACHVDQIQAVGDYVLYEIGRTSIIVVRVAEDEIRAYYNACLHRGRQLCDADGNTRAFRCPFHGFMWKLDGRLSHIPSRWDFPDLDGDTFRLPEVKVERWAGFVFVNLDPEAAPLAEHLGDMPAHFANWGFENRRLTGHVGIVIKANWKVVADGFLEYFHAMATHPQAISFTSDVGTRYVARTDRPGYSCMTIPSAVASPFVANRIDEQTMLDGMLRATDPRIQPGSHPLRPGENARSRYAEIRRQQLGAATGRDFSKTSDIEMVDLIVYSLFPNVSLWGAYSLPIWYRFRPWNDDPEQALMEIFIMPEFPAGAPRSPAPKMRLLGPEQRFSDAPELAGMAEVFDQDLDNFEHVQKGMHSMTRPALTLSRYQESENRHFHAMVDAWISRGFSR